MKRVLTVGVTYTGEKIEGVEIERLGLCQAGVDKERAAFPLRLGQCDGRCGGH